MLHIPKFVRSKLRGMGRSTPHSSWKDHDFSTFIKHMCVSVCRLETKGTIKKQAVENQNCHDVILKYSWSVLKKDLVILFQFNRCCHYARFGSAEVLDLLNYQLTSHS